MATSAFWVFIPDMRQRSHNYITAFASRENFSDIAFVNSSYYITIVLFIYFFSFPIFTNNLNYVLNFNLNNKKYDLFVCPLILSFSFFFLFTEINFRENCGILTKFIIYCLVNSTNLWFSNSRIVFNFILYWR